MGQRLLRAKRRSPTPASPTACRPPTALPERLDGVLAVVYLVFTEGYAAPADERPGRRGDPARPTAGRADARRRRGPRPPGPDAAAARPPGRSASSTASWSRWRTRTAPAGTPAPSPRRWPSVRGSGRRAGRLPHPGRAGRRPRHRASTPARPTGCASSSCYDELPGGPPVTGGGAEPGHRRRHDRRSARRPRRARRRSATAAPRRPPRRRGARRAAGPGRPHRRGPGRAGAGHRARPVGGRASSARSSA